LSPEAYAQAKLTEDAAVSAAAPANGGCGGGGATMMGATTMTSGGGGGAGGGGGGRTVRLDGIPDHLRDSKTGGEVVKLKLKLFDRLFAFFLACFKLG
jgi:hypothetical protein